MSSSITGFGLEECKQTRILFRANYTYQPSEIYIFEELGEFYYATSENPESYLPHQQGNNNHLKEYTILHSGYVRLQNIKSSNEKG